MNLEVLEKNSFGKIKNEFENVRIEPVDDPKLNNILFSLYKQLINPVREIENRMREIHNKQSQIAAINNTVYFYFSKILKLSVPFGIASIVLMFGLAFIDESHPYVVMGEKYVNFIDSVLGSLTDAGVPVVIGFLVYMLMLFGGLYLISVPIPILIVVLKNYILKTKNKKKQQKSWKKLSLLKLI